MSHSAGFLYKPKMRLGIYFGIYGTIGSPALERDERFVVCFFLRFADFV